MTLLRAIIESNISNLSMIAVTRNGGTIYRGTIANLLKTRKDLLDLELDGELSCKVSQGYFCNCK